jgi:hypothetical protein
MDICVCGFHLLNLTVLPLVSSQLMHPRNQARTINVMYDPVQENA